MEPIGIGTGSVEGLTSYVMRLAAAHAVWVGDLVGRELFPGDAPAIRSSVKEKRIYSHGFAGASYWIDGASECPATWVAALEGATFRSSLRLLTLIPFAAAVSERLLFRLQRAWCPTCLEEQRMAGLVVYEPLIWGLRIAKVCAHHSKSLEEVCPHCARRMRPLAIYSRPGCCSWCGGWLGVTRTAESMPEASDYDVWLAASLGELLAYAPNLQANSLGALLRRNLSVMIDRVGSGNRAAFAHAAHCSRAVVGDWLDGRTLPRLDLLLPLCYWLGVRPMNLFTEVGPRINLGKCRELATAKDRGVRLLRPRKELEAALKVALTEEPPPTLHGLARRMGYRSTSWFYNVDLAMCKQITANNRKWKREHLNGKQVRICTGLEEIKAALEGALAQERAISVNEVATNMGYVSCTYMRKKFPELCGAISRRFAAQRRARVESVLLDALEEDPPPTVYRIVRRAGANTVALRKAFPHLCDQLRARRESFQEEWAAEPRQSLEEALREQPAPSIRTVCLRLDLHPVMLAKMFPDLIADQR